MAPRLKRRGFSPFWFSALSSAGLAVAVWAVIGVAFPGSVGQMLGLRHGPVLISLGVFGVTMALWSRFHSSWKEELDL
ncbi:MAG: hypothetical protein JRN58_10380 [Nitrososphaerota archaeon]|jgi:hypothetical protein|nr:hypothetical protein [Nitrososphaerota archaeon]